MLKDGAGSGGGGSGMGGCLWGPSYSSPQLFESSVIFPPPILEAWESLCDDFSLSYYLTETLRMITWSQWTPELWETIVRNDYWLFRTTMFGVICYADIDNWNCFEAVVSPDSFSISVNLGDCFFPTLAEDELFFSANGKTESI